MVVTLFIRLSLRPLRFLLIDAIVQLDETTGWPFGNTVMRLVLLLQRHGLRLMLEGSSDTGELPLVYAAARAPDGRGWVADWTQLHRHPGPTRRRSGAMGGQVFPRFGSCGTEIPPLLAVENLSQQRTESALPGLSSAAQRRRQGRTRPLAPDEADRAPAKRPAWPRQP